MIDKVQKIREEVIKLFNHVKDSNFESDSGAFYYLKDLLDFIDSLQEEPKPKFKIGDMVVSESGKYAKIESIDTDKYWCKGENGMSIPFKYQDKWKLVEEPVSENLEEAAKDYSNTLDNICGSVGEQTRNAFKAGAKWQKAKLMAKAIDATCFGFQGAALFTFRLPAGSYLVGSKVKVIIIKED